MPDEKRIEELTQIYSDGMATDEQIRELFTALGESETQIEHRIAVERDLIDPDEVVV